MASFAYRRFLSLRVDLRKLARQNRTVQGPWHCRTSFWRFLWRKDVTKSAIRTADCTHTHTKSLHSKTQPESTIARARFYFTMSYVQRVFMQIYVHCSPFMYDASSTSLCRLCVYSTSFDFTFLFILRYLHLGYFSHFMPVCERSFRHMNNVSLCIVPPTCVKGRDTKVAR